MTTQTVHTFRVLLEVDVPIDPDNPDPNHEQRLAETVASGVIDQVSDVRLAWVDSRSGWEPRGDLKPTVSDSALEDAIRMPVTVPCGVCGATLGQACFNDLSRTTARAYEAPHTERLMAVMRALFERCCEYAPHEGLTCTDRADLVSRRGTAGKVSWSTAEQA